MNINDIFPSKYLKASDLEGAEPTVTISHCEIEQMGDQAKLVIYFQGKKKGLACNKTNADRIAFLYSPDTDNWTGKEITIYAEMVTFQGKTMEGLRVKPPKKRSGPAPAKHPMAGFANQKRPEAPPNEGFDDEIPGWGADDAR